MASGPLITTINDLVAVVVYYGLAMIVLIDIFPSGLKGINEKRSGTHPVPEFFLFHTLGIQYRWVSVPSSES